ncbi:M4 family metallopeptidase [Streptomyces sp. NPDC001070]
MAALLGVALQTSPATARADEGRGSTVRALPDPGSLQVRLSPTRRAGLLRAAAADRAATARSLHLGAREQLVPTDVVEDADGTLHTRYQRTYAGLPVLGGDLVVHRAADGSTARVTRASSAPISLVTTTAQRSAPAAGARKVVWVGTGAAVLAWETVTTGTRHDGTPSELHTITDAATGKKLTSYEAVTSGIGNSQYSGQVTIGTALSGSVYQLTDAARGGHRTYDLNGGTSGTGTLFTDADDVWGNGSTSSRQTAGVDAAYGAQETWDFYKNTFGRNGIRNDGVGAYSRVHYGNAYVNAFWSDSCFCMTYGDGAGNQRPLTSLDVAGHEMTHGVTAATANLRYSGEPGGLNEATSDILGTAVEFYAANGSDPGDYLIGEKIDINGNGTPLRYMDRPSKDGSSADYWSKNVGRLDVHYSSGVANHFFYLLSEGSGTKTVNGVTYSSATYDGLAVPGIGRANAVAVWYRALTTYMTSRTDYAGARTATLQAAADLFGAGSATYNTVANTWAAVNVGTRVS